MHYEKENLSNLYYNVQFLNHNAKLRRVWVIPKYFGQIFSELLRRGGRDATKGGQRPKSCREQINIPNYFVVSKELFTFAALTMIYSLKL